jgi:hypothetical protein
MQDKKPEEKVFEAKLTNDTIMANMILTSYPDLYDNVKIQEPQVLKSTLVITDKLFGL